MTVTRFRIFGLGHDRAAASAFRPASVIRSVATSILCRRRGPDWVHEIKHDGFRMMVRRDPTGVRLLTRNGHDWADRYPAIVEAVNRLKARSCLIDGEAVACDENGLAMFERLRRKHGGQIVFLFALVPRRQRK